MAEILEATGQPHKATKYRAAYNKWLPEFNHLFYSGDEEGYWVPNKGDRLINEHANRIRKDDPSIGAQTAQVLALELGLVPEDKRDSVADVLARNIRKNGNHLQTGIQGTRALFTTLAECGYGDLAAEMMLSKAFPSWGYMAEQGATTIAESWAADGGAMSHPGLAGGISWIFSHLAGIQPAGAGFKQIHLAPVFPQQLDWVRADYDCPYGQIRSEWKKTKNGAVVWNVTVPPNTTAAAEVPKGMVFEDGSERIKLTAGSYELKMEVNPFERFSSRSKP